MYRLRTIGPPYETFPLKTGAYRFGSAPDSEMIIQDPSVAPYHCELVVTAKTIILRDLSPNHDTYVNDEQVQYTRLEMGQTLRLGGVTLVLEDAGGEAVAASSESGQPQTRAVAVVKTSARVVKSLALPGLALLGIAGIVALIWYSTNQESGSTAKPERAAEKSSSRDKKKREVETPSLEAAGSSASSARAGGTDRPSSKSTGARASRPASEDPRLAFNPRQTNRTPTLDIKDAEILLRTERYVRAEPFLQRALRNQLKTVGPEDPEVTKTLETMGRLYQRAGQFNKAEPCLQQVVRTVEKARGPEHPETATALNNLGEMYKLSGQFAKAAPLLDRALQVREKSLGPDHQDVGQSLNSLAGLYGAQGEYGKAKPLLERTLKTFETNLPPTDPRVAQALSDLGELHRTMGDDTQAEPLLRRALNLKEKASPSDVPGLTSALNDLADLQASKGDNTQAEQLLQKALKTTEDAYGPDNAKTLLSLNNLAEHYRERGAPEKAAPLLQKATNVAEKAFGPEHPETAKSVKNLADLQQEMGDSFKAEPLLERASKTLEKALGPEHPDTVESLDDLAALNVCAGDKIRGPQTGGQAVRAKLKLLSAIVSYASEQQRLAYREGLDLYSLAASMDAIPELALAILRYKGVLLDSLLEDRLITQATRNPKDRAMVEELRSAKDRLAQLLFEIPEDLSPAAQQQRQAEKIALAKDVEVLEGVLAHRVPGLGRARNALRITVEQVQQAIPEQAVLLELARYSRCLGTNQWEAGFGALVLAANGKPQWVPLGSAEAIEKNIERYQNAMRGPNENRGSQPEAGRSPAVQNPEFNTPNASPGSTNSAAANTGDEFATLLQTLYGQIWAPIEPAIPPGTKTVMISPARGLNLISFATLLTPDNEFLGQKYSVCYVSSGRDLLAEKKSARQGPVFVLCNPDFANQELIADQSSASNPFPMQFLDRKDLAALGLSPLPGTLKEAAMLESRAQKLKWPIKVFGGNGASEAQLAAFQSPRILHLATHAFSLPDGPAAAETKSQRAARVKPLSESRAKTASTAGGASPGSGGSFTEGSVPRNIVHRNGMLLAGGQATLKAWNRGEIPPSSNDGVVTAGEVGTLKLGGTELVVLSAASVALGGARSGDGVLSLRRAFVQAGAENLLMGLWTVSDSAMAEMMGEFYERLHQTGQAAQALVEVQRDWLKRTRKERGLEAAVRLAGSFVLSSQGPQRAR